MKYKVYLDDKYIATYKTFDKSMEGIRKDFKNNNISPKYIRMWKKENTYIIDYGSHSSFYKVQEVE